MITSKIHGFSGENWKILGKHRHLVMKANNILINAWRDDLRAFVKSGKQNVKFN